MNETKHNPGTEEAQAAGCQCPVIDNHYGKGLPDGSFIYVNSCPYHGRIVYERDKQNTNHSTTGVESFIEQGKKELRVFLRAIQVVRDKDTSGVEEWFEEYSESLLSQRDRPSTGTETWEEDFRKQYDELGLKSPKGSMKNLERELIIDYFRKLLSQAKREGYIRALQDVRLDKFPTYERIDEEIKRFYNH